MTTLPQHTPSITTAIHTLKAEILSPDWTLSPKRNTNCTKAMGSLDLFFNKQRYTKGLIAMSKQLLAHFSQEHTPQPRAIDLLKELMAHIVTIYEQEENDTLAEKKICAQCLRQFKKLGISIKVTKGQLNQFAIANASLKQNVENLQSLASNFTTLSSTQQIQTMLTIQSLIAETKTLQTTLRVS